MDKTNELIATSNCTMNGEKECDKKKSYKKRGREREREEKKIVDIRQN